MTRSMAKMRRLVTVCSDEIFAARGLAGVGDLIAMHASKYSQNRIFGRQFTTEFWA